MSVTAGAGCAWTAAVVVGIVRHGDDRLRRQRKRNRQLRCRAQPDNGVAFRHAHHRRADIHRDTGCGGLHLHAVAGSATPRTAGGSRPLSVTTNGTNCAWTASTAASFLTITREQRHRQRTRRLHRRREHGRQLPRRHADDCGADVHRHADRQRAGDVARQAVAALRRDQDVAGFTSRRPDRPSGCRKQAPAR